MRMLTHLVERYGDIRAYVLEATGVMEADVGRICSMLMGPDLVLKSP